MEADGARFLWLDEYRHREIFEGFGSPEEPVRCSAIFWGHFQIPIQQSLAIPAAHAVTNAGQALHPCARSELGTCET
jgi:hypothetical protein